MGRTGMEPARLGGQSIGVLPGRGFKADASRSAGRLSRQRAISHLKRKTAETIEAVGSLVGPVSRGMGDPVFQGVELARVEPGLDCSSRAVPGDVVRPDAIMCGVMIERAGFEPAPVGKGDPLSGVELVCRHTDGLVARRRSKADRPPACCGPGVPQGLRGRHVLAPTPSRNLPKTDETWPVLGLTKIHEHGYTMGRRRRFPVRWRGAA